MSFQLTIAEGKEAGKEFEFEQDSVLIGRVTECDVVLYDAGISRRHCRIFAEGGTYFVEDLGSSNGTQVNGKLVKQKQALAEGDKLSLGPVVFVFRPVAGELVTDPGGVSADSTRIVSVDTVSRQRNRGAALAPEGANEEELEEARLNTTRPIQALRSSTRPGTQPALPSGGAPSPAVHPRQCSGRRARCPGACSGVRPSAPKRPTTNAVARSAPAAQGGGLSAAERARIRRESPGLVAQARLFWADAEPRGAQRPHRPGRGGGAEHRGRGVLGRARRRGQGGAWPRARDPQRHTHRRLVRPGRGRDVGERRIRRSSSGSTPPPPGRWPSCTTRPRASPRARWW